MTKVTTAMLLAAGRGERMRPFTDTHPKPLAPLRGKTLIQHHVEKLANAGIQRVVINLAWLGHQIRDTLGDGAQFGVELLYSDEGATALETGGGIYKALPLLGANPFWVVSADLWTDFVFDQAERRLAETDLAHLIMVQNPDFNSKGDFNLQNGRVSEIDGERLTYASLALFRPELFAGCSAGRYSVVPLIKSAMQLGRVSGEVFAGRWFNIGTTAQLQEVDAFLRAGK
jgi:N-acetyl-alpha-D-muramate 1-phosphate uridylyltransferase